MGLVVLLIKEMEKPKLDKRSIIISSIGLVIAVFVGFKLYLEAKCSGSRVAQAALCDTQRLIAQQRGESPRKVSTTACFCSGR